MGLADYFAIKVKLSPGHFSGACEMYPTALMFVIYLQAPNPCLSISSSSLLSSCTFFPRVQTSGAALPSLLTSLTFRRFLYFNTPLSIILYITLHIYYSFSRSLPGSCIRCAPNYVRVCSQVFKVRSDAVVCVGSCYLFVRILTHAEQKCIILTQVDQKS